MKRAAALFSALLAVAGASACATDETLEVGPVGRGRELFGATTASRNVLNPFSCASCHVTAGDPGHHTGGTLAGVARRPSYWGGKEADLLTAVNLCIGTFMLDPRGIDRDEERARDLFAFLGSLEGPATAVPFTVVGDVKDVPRGDVARGVSLYASACRSCHGAMHTALGALPRVPSLPEDTLKGHPGYTPLELRLQVVEKVRHGPYFGYGGSMPPFSSEVLSDQALGDVLEALGFRGE